MSYHEIIVAMGWVLSILSGLVIFLYEKKWRLAPWAGIICQLVWYTYIIYSSQTPLLLGVTLYMIVHIIGVRQWPKQHRQALAKERKYQELLKREAEWKLWRK